MTYIEPKIDWTDNEAPVGSDFNRIEGNAKANHEAIITEVGIRKNDIETEADIRASADISEVNARLAAMDNRVVGNANGNIPRNDGNLNVNLKAQYVQYSPSRGVYGETNEDNGFGVFGYSGGGGSPVGVIGSTLGSSSPGIGVLGGSTSIGVEGNGGVWDFYAAGTGGNYGPFTGAHEVSIIGNIPEPGMILSCTGNIIKKDKSISATIPECKISSTEKDKKVFGVFTGLFELQKDIVGENENIKIEGHWCKDTTKQYGICNALGDGQVLVSNINGEINCGDYITTSEIAGYGQKQDDDIIHSYTLGKCIETIDWSLIKNSDDGYKRALMACIYVSA